MDERLKLAIPGLYQVYYICVRWLLLASWQCVCEMACLGITNKVVLPVTQFAILLANNKKERDSTSNKDNYTPWDRMHHSLALSSLTLCAAICSAKSRTHPKIFSCVLRARIALRASIWAHHAIISRYLLMRRARRIRNFARAASLTGLRLWRYH